MRFGRLPSAMAGARVDISSSSSSSSYSPHSSWSSLLESRTPSEPFFLVTGAVPSGSTDFTRNLYSKPELKTIETITSVLCDFWDRH